LQIHILPFCGCAIGAIPYARSIRARSPGGSGAHNEGHFPVFVVVLFCWVLLSAKKKEADFPGVSIERRCLAFKNQTGLLSTMSANHSADHRALSSDAFIPLLLHQR
jgi:hypothetical protein